MTAGRGTGNIGIADAKLALAGRASEGRRVIEKWIAIQRVSKKMSHGWRV
ncbi:hypothetical protein V512_003355 [Mesotoga sp. Brook.08.105.5.1]|nr:hypothetical protein V512_003355 [Mesotoga sp. Brook.08.105.5.1]